MSFFQAHSGVFEFLTPSPPPHPHRANKPSKADDGALLNTIIPAAMRRELGAVLNVGEIVLFPADSAPGYSFVVERIADVGGAPQYNCTCKKFEKKLEEGSA